MARILAQMGVRAVDASGATATVAPRAEPDPWYLWPCNLPVWTVWCRAQTQWRVGMAGATGLDYAAVWSVIDRALPRRRRDEAFAAIQSMERAVLDVWAQQRER